MSAASMLDGQGQSLILIAEDSSTVWVQQTVAVTPRDWFTASALLAPLDGIEAAWLCIAWYASVDGSGAQLSTEDSPAVTSGTPAAMVRSAYEVVLPDPCRRQRKRTARAGASSCVLAPNVGPLSSSTT